MRCVATLSITFAVSFLCSLVAAQDNPYMQMVEMKYADYSLLLHDAYLKFNLLDTIEAQNVILQIKEGAKKTVGMEWQLRAERLNLELALRKQSLSGETRYTDEMIAQKLLGFVHK